MASLRGMFFLMVGFLNTALHGSLIVLVSLLIPLTSPALQKRMKSCVEKIAEDWVRAWSLIFRTLTPSLRWSVQMPVELDHQRWHLILANHQSWVDILVLFHIFHRRLPFLRFFLKYELLYFPFLGLACKALNMPFMKRYSAAYLDRHPHKRGADLARTRAACAHFQDQPVAIVNFLEGTRLSADKQAQQHSPYRYLLRPKTGGIAFVLQALENKMDSVLDVTIAYPEGTPTLWDLACGRLHHVVVTVEQRDIPHDCRHGDYTRDGDYQRRFQAWIAGLWLDKDRHLARLLGTE